MDPGANPPFGQRGGGGMGDPMDEGASAGTEEADLMFAKRGCCCFWVPCFGSGRSSSKPGGGGPWGRIGGGGGGVDGEAAASLEGRWWRRALMKAREWSEIVAGPRWKTFIRRFNRNYRGGGGHHGFCGGGGGGGGSGGGGGGKMGKFQYDPLSYALNFDEGHGQNGNSDREYGYRDFSARFAAPPASAKSSMDLGGRDAPPLFAAA